MSQPASSSSPSPCGPRRASRWRSYAIGVSVGFHLLLLIGLAVWYVGRQREPGEGDAAAAAGDASAPASPNLPPQPQADVTPRQVAATLERAVDHFQTKSDEERLSELEKQAARLETLASEKSVDEMARKFHEWMNTPPRAGRPAEAPADGPFDFDTAQIHEVRRQTAEEGLVYRAVLVDAAGRTMEVEMSPEEGERAHAALEKLKAFPLADKVYRQIAMPLIDKALARGEPGPAEEPAADDDRDPFDETP